jgi:hypothetical protein
MPRTGHGRTVSSHPQPDHRTEVSQVRHRDGAVPWVAMGVPVRPGAPSGSCGGGVTDYLSPTVQAQVEVERRRLAAHRPGPDDGLCVVCRRPAPCDDANDAAGFLAERGLLVPGRLVSREPESGTLLTYAWKLRFGLLRRRR